MRVHWDGIAMYSHSSILIKHAYNIITILYIYIYYNICDVYDIYIYNEKYSWTTAFRRPCWGGVGWGMY